MPKSAPRSITPTIVNGAIVEPNRLADDRWIAPERPRPEALADHDHRGTTGPRLVGA